MDSGFEQRGRALEDGFFHQQNQALLQKMRDDLAKKSAKEALVEASGISDQTVIDGLADLGINAETLLALSVFPLVHVAWADGSVSPEERKAVLEAAAKNGCTADSPSHAMLSGWLESKPPSELFDAWKDYTQELLKSLGATSASAASELRKSVADRTQSVAEAAGGFLGIGKVSAAETAAIESIKAALGE